MPAVYIPAVLELMPAVNIQKYALFLSVEAFNELMMAREKEVNTLIEIIGEKLVRLGKIQVEIMRIKMPECSTDIIGPLRTRWTCPIYLPGGCFLILPNDKGTLETSTESLDGTSDDEFKNVIPDGKRRVEESEYDLEAKDSKEQQEKELTGISNRGQPHDKFSGREPYAGTNRVQYNKYL